MAYHRDSGSGGKRGGQRFGGPKKFFDKPSFKRGSGSGKPALYAATCADCGAGCQVPFKPNGSKPVYCSNCFAEDDRFSNQPKRFAGRETNLSDALNEINNKLDLIIRSLDN